MRQVFYFLVIFCSWQFVISQENIKAVDTTNTKVIDTKYKEDQFYLGLTYNLLDKMPSEMSQHGFSAGFSFGFIKDIPLNKQRNFGLGIGLGFSTNSLNHNLKIYKEDDVLKYEFLDADEFSKNKLSSQVIEVPLELRWRTSTPEVYKFWRVYAGVKFGYLVGSKTKFSGGGEKQEHSNIDAFKKVNYGLTLSGGYSTWNINLYYGLNSIFEDTVVVEGRKIEASVIKIGLMFYIL